MKSPRKHVDERGLQNALVTLDTGSLGPAELHPPRKRVWSAMFAPKRVDVVDRALDFVQTGNQSPEMALSAQYLDSVSYRKDHRETVDYLITHTELSDRAGQPPQAS